MCDQGERPTPAPNQYCRSWFPHPGPISEGVQQVELPSLHVVEEQAVLSQTTVKEEEEDIVEILKSGDDFEIFNQLLSSEPPIADLSDLPPALVSYTQEAPFVPDTMVLQRKMRTSLLGFLESHTGGNVPKKAVQPKPPALPSTQTSQLNLADKKRKRDPKGKEVLEERRNLPSKEAEPQRGGKHARVTETRSSNEGAIIDRRGDHHIEVPAWTPSIVLDEASLPSDASIRDFQQSRAEYVANAVEQVLFLPSDIADLRSIRKHEVFLSLKRDYAMVSPLTNFLLFEITLLFSLFFFFLQLYFFLWQVLQAICRVEEMINFSYRQMKEEEGRHVAVVDPFDVAEKKI